MIGPPPPRRVVVVGGGISGLAAARALRRTAGVALQVVLLEASVHLGGKLRVSEVAGVPVDEGAEAMLARRPEGLRLARDAGLHTAVVTPASTAAGVWTRGTLRPLPAGQVLGIPGDLRALASSRVLTPAELGRATVDLVLPASPLVGSDPGEDVAVGGYVAARLGRAVVDRLVEPLLGGVYAGRADAISLAAAVPQLAAAARAERSLIRAARRVRAGASAPESPVFASLRGGLGQLPAAVAAASGAEIRTGSTVRELGRTATSWRLAIGSARAPEILEADAVVLAVPAGVAARLLAPVAPASAAELAPIEYASVAILTLAYPSSAAAGALPGSGFLVPPVEGRTVKGATFSSSKWGWYADVAPGLVVVRLSLGRHGEEADLQREDADIITRAAGELAEATGVRGRPVDARVTRWGGALPQYAVGHLDRVRRARAGLAGLPTLAVCGAAYDGIGVPACIASGEAAAATVLSGLSAGVPAPAVVRENEFHG
ncbi:MAG: protoporphyrinogen oxidase [Actinomycetota bacterium]|nr:protoporphyrinogen oxidase [Actinomycetota bacterium]